jgi:hypothetical protein
MLGWPEPYIYGVYTVIWAKKLPNIRIFSYTRCIYTVLANPKEMPCSCFLLYLSFTCMRISWAYNALYKNISFPLYEIHLYEFVLSTCENPLVWKHLLPKCEYPLVWKYLLSTFMKISWAYNACTWAVSMQHRVPLYTCLALTAGLRLVYLRCVQHKYSKPWQVIRKDKYTYSPGWSCIANLRTLFLKEEGSKSPSGPTLASEGGCELSQVN